MVGSDRIPGLSGYAYISLLFVMGLGLTLWPATGEALQPPRSVEDFEVFDALAHITVIKEQHRNARVEKQESTGSGVIISEQGHVVTNHHVAGDALSVEVTLPDQRTLSAEVVGEDPLTDLAVLKLPGDEAPYAFAQFGDASSLAIGDRVWALGSPWALSRTVTEGIVSNDERVFDTSDGVGFELERGQQTGLFTQWIQHDAGINPGNSGGPLVNRAGQVVGINQLGGGEGVGFAIPSELVETITQRLIRDGQIKRSWPGFGVQPINDTQYDRGMIVRYVAAGGPADEAGLQAGDRIVSVDGDTRTVRYDQDVPDFYSDLANRPVGETYTLGVLRDGEERTVDVSPEPLENRDGDRGALRLWGLNLEEVTSPLAVAHQFRSDTGLMVYDLRSGGPAASARPELRQHDVIREVNGQPVSNLEDLQRINRDLGAGEDVLIRGERNRARFYSVLELEEPNEFIDRRTRIARAWIGLETQVLNAKLREQLTANLDQGVIVRKVHNGTRVSDSSIREGDIITRVNGDEIGARYSRHNSRFESIIERLAPGDTVDLTVNRDSDTFVAQTRLESSPVDRTDARRYKDRKLELTVRELTFEDITDSGWEPGTKGVVVDQVESAGLADRAGLRSGDLIQKIDGDSITDLKEASTNFQTIVDEARETIELRAKRGQSTHWFRIERELEE